jgi:hypothetical protein
LVSVLRTRMGAWIGCWLGGSRRRDDDDDDDDN